MEAALTGIDGPGWIDVEDAEEKAAADAAAALVDQMQKRTGDDDLGVDRESGRSSREDHL